jgi:hypothetical protein
MVNRARIVVFMSQHILGGERQRATACFCRARSKASFSS